MPLCDISTDVAIQALIIDYLREQGYTNIVRGCLDSFSPRAAELSNRLECSFRDLCEMEFLWWSFDGTTNLPFSSSLAYEFDEEGNRVFKHHLLLESITSEYRRKQLMSILKERKACRHGKSKSMGKINKKIAAFMKREHGRSENNE